MKSVQSFMDGRKLSSKNRWLFLPLLFWCLIISSCAGGGIGGSGVTAGPASNGDIGITSIGPITALGSISVNGIEFETTGTTVTLAGVNGDARDLQVGMVVKVEGTVHADGKTGKANVVLFSPNAVGPITSIDLGKGSLEVMGQTVLVDMQTIIAGLPGNTPGLAGLAIDDLVEISGLTDADGNIKATRIARKTMGAVTSIDLDKGSLEVMGQTVLVDVQTVIAGLSGNTPGLAGLATNDLVEISGLADADGNIIATKITRKTASRPYEVSGRVSNLTNATFKINALTVDYGSAVLSKFGSVGIQAGDFVEVKGDLTSQTALQADIIEKRSPDFKAGHIEMEGFIDTLFYAGPSISGFAMITPFGLQRVELIASTVFSGGWPDQVKAGARVKVEGMIQNHTILIEKLVFF